MGVWSKKSDHKAIPATVNQVQSVQPVGVDPGADGFQMRNYIG
jgi:hypothetical protein